MQSPTAPAAYRHQHRLCPVPLHSPLLYTNSLPLPRNPTKPIKRLSWWRGTSSLHDHLSLRCALTQITTSHALFFFFNLQLPISPHWHALLASQLFIEPLNFNLLHSSITIHSHIPFSSSLCCSCVTVIMASRVALVLFMCVLPAMVAAIRPAKSPFCVKGRVFCDPCRAGFETSATTYIAGNCWPPFSRPFLFQSTSISAYIII